MTTKKLSEITLKPTLSNRLFGFGVYSISGLLEGALTFMYYIHSTEGNDYKFYREADSLIAQTKIVKKIGAGMATSNNHLYQKGIKEWNNIGRLK